MAGAIPGNAEAFEVLLRFVVDKQGLQAVQSGAVSMSDAVRRLGDEGQLMTLAATQLGPALDVQIKKTAELQNAWWKTQRVLRASAFVFKEIAMVGTAMILPFIGAAVKFAAEAKKVADKDSTDLDPIAAKWIKLSDSIKVSTMSIGKTSATVLMPYFETLDKLVSRAATFVEKNPDVIKAALTVGAIVLSIGTLGALVTNGVKMVVDVKFVWASLQNVLASQGMIRASGQNLEAAIMMLQASGSYDMAQAALLSGTGPALATGGAGPLAAAGGYIAGLATKMAGGLKGLTDKAAILIIGASAGIANKLVGAGNWVARSLFTTSEKLAFGIAGALSKASSTIMIAGTGGATKLYGASNALSAALLKITPAVAAQGLKLLGVTAIALAIGAEIGKLIGNAINKQIQGEDYKEQGLGDAFRTLTRIETTVLQLVILKLNKLGIVSDSAAAAMALVTKSFDTWITKLLHLDKAAGDAGDAIESLSQALEGNEHEAEIVKAYTKMIEEEAAAAKELAKDQLKVVEAANRKTVEAMEKAREDINKIGGNLAKAIDKIRADSRKDELRREQDHQLDIAKTIRDAEIDREKEEEDHQERLRKLALAHDRKVEQLTIERDAFGLRQENISYKDAVTEEDQQYDKDRRRAKEALDLKLKDMEESYKLERKRRLDDVEETIKEKQKEAAEAITQRKIELAKELTEVRRKRDEELRELIAKNLEEHNKRREAFIALVRDLDANLLGEKALKAKYYALMLKDADAFLAAYRKKLPTAPKSAGGVGGVVTGGGGVANNYVPSATLNPFESSMPALGNLMNLRTRQTQSHGNQIINLYASNGVTVKQVTRMLTESNSLVLRDLAHAIGA